MELLTISEIRRRAQNGLVAARLHAQISAAEAKATRDGKPYCEIALADACDRMTLRVWSDHPEYRACESLQPAEFVERAERMFKRVVRDDHMGDLRLKPRRRGDTLDPA